MTARSAPTPRLRDLPRQRRVLDGRAYDDHLYRLQLELLRLQTRLRDSRRLTGRLDPRGDRVHPIGPPTEIEKAQHSLWRFSSRMPAPTAWSRDVGAAEEMLARTHAPFAPWTVVPGDDEHYARVAVLRQVVKQIGALL